MADHELKVPQLGFSHQGRNSKQTITWNVAGTCTLSLTVFNEAGDSSVASKTYTVTN